MAAIFCLLAMVMVTDTVEVAQQALQGKHRQHKSHRHQKESKDAKPTEKESAPAPAPAPARAPADPDGSISSVSDPDDVSTPTLPFGDMEPFGREATAQQLTEDSIKESNAMVDSIEKAEVAEEQRSVFRALTRLRGAALASFDGIARSATGNIEEYSVNSKWRKEHGVKHLADEEDDVANWAFPSNAD